MYTAHKRDEDGKIQTVREHSINVSLLAEEYLSTVELASVGRLVGLLHDAGKLRTVFDDYINGRNNMKRGSIDHSYAGAKYLRELANDKEKMIEVAAAGMAHTILSHHGISDWIDEEGNDEYGRRTSKDEGYAEIKANITELCTEEEASEMLVKAAKEWSTAIKELMTGDKEEMAFYAGMTERLIQSALIDADRIDTADFMSGKVTGPEPERIELWKQANSNMELMLSGFSQYTDRISQQRRSISDRCAEFAEHRVGACRLIVPTGGGKTLSSLRFAFRQCMKYGLKRVIYVAPFMSILEQNSDVIRGLVGDDNFLEHHSDMVSEISDSAELEAYQLFAERWDKPVIATTMVQFLNTLFSARTSSVRRMHRMCDSVIIIDEVQSVPLRCTELFDLAVNFLVKKCNTAVVLCSATQPPYDDLEKHRLIYDAQKDMVGDHSKDFEVFKRTEVIPALRQYGYDTDEAVDFCCERFRENEDLLVIVNTKKQAREIYSKLKDRLSEEAYMIHLSTNMCPAHRKKRIGTLRRFLKRNKPVVCVTTQLIEAGVDISFRCVVRALAGIDNAAQAAGRCNRNGEYSKVCPVYIINLKAERLGNLEEIKTAQTITRHIIDNVDGDLLSVEMQRRYFKMLFERYKDKLSYPVKAGGVYTTILELLSDNKRRWKLKKKTEPVISQAFRTAGDLFEVIDSRTKNVIVPYDKRAREIISKIESSISPQETARLMRKAQKYTVSIYAGDEKILNDKGALYLNILDRRYYSNEYGVDYEGAEQEVLIF